MTDPGLASFVREAEQALAAIESGESPSADSLMVTCQNLVTWASRFDPERHGPDASIPSESERQAGMAAIETLTTLIHAYEVSMESIQADLKKNHHNRRALAGYGCIKSLASHSQFVNRKI